MLSAKTFFPLCHGNKTVLVISISVVDGYGLFLLYAAYLPWLIKRKTKGKGVLKSS